MCFSEPSEAAEGHDSSANKVEALEFWVYSTSVNFKREEKLIVNNIPTYWTPIGKKNVLSYQENPKLHTFLVTMLKFNGLGYEWLPHPSYSPDLVLENYFLFPTM